MRLQYLGDSYDIVKQSLLRWLAPLGPWAAHPMFTETVAAEDAAALSRLLGIPLLSTAVLGAETNRRDYLAPARDTPTHVFLDPDTGLRLKPVGGAKSVTFVFGPELRDIVKSRSGTLTLVFDQSLGRGREREGILRKIEALGGLGVHAVAYRSHACFLLASDDGDLVQRAAQLVLGGSYLPVSRFVGIR